jgi:hypothetical protein
LIAGLEITPLRVIQPITQVGTVEVIADDDVNPGDDTSIVGIFVPGIFW